jgi:ankyrin repeat protein
MKNYNSIFEAAAAGDQAGVYRFIRSGDVATAVDQQGKTVLHHAAVGGNVEIIRMLVNDSANLDAQDADGRTPLQDAEQAGKKDAIKVLKELGATG